MQIFAGLLANTSACKIDICFESFSAVDTLIGQQTEVGTDRVVAYTGRAKVIAFIAALFVAFVNIFKKIVLQNRLLGRLNHIPRYFIRWVN